MKDKYFRIALYSMLSLCIILTAIHLIYIIMSYQQSSIIYFISKELW